jgi:hypothetical protein
MKNHNYIYLTKIILLLFCLHLLACEKEEVGLDHSDKPASLIPGGPHGEEDSDWKLCGKVRKYPLIDENGNPMPAGYVPAGEVSVSTSMDSLRLEIQMNAYWNMRSVSWKVSTKTQELPGMDWQSKSYAEPVSFAEIRLPRPKGRIAAIQINVNGQRFNLMGVVNYCGEMSPQADICADGTHCINFILPNPCDAGANESFFALLN